MKIVGGASLELPLQASGSVWRGGELGKSHLSTVDWPEKMTHTLSTPVSAKLRPLGLGSPGRHSYGLVSDRRGER